MKKRDNWWLKHEISSEYVSKIVCVELWEYERGWGSKLDSKRYFNDLRAAQAFRDDFNKENTAKEVPDWYMVAKI